MKTSLIIFSKDRTLQLKSLLLSIKANTDISEKNIYVIYKNVIKEISFGSLKDSFNCTFVEQGDFLEDLKNIVLSSPSTYFQFMVDDLIVKDKISLEQVETFMDDNPDVDSFCFRMGKNIKCGRQPEFKEHDGGILTWETAKGLGKHWNYAWDVSSSLYRKEIVIEYLKKCRHHRETFPNPFEDHFYTCMPSTKPMPWLVALINAVRFCCKKKPMRIACFEESKCFTQGVNLVADIKDDREQQFDPITLHNKMLEGYVIDFESLKDVSPEQPNAGHQFFKLRKYFNHE
jgi:hypothetical protein